MVIVTRIHCVNLTFFQTTQKQVEEETRKLDKPHSEEKVAAVINHCHGYIINQIAIIIHLRNPFTSLHKSSTFVPSKP